MSTAVTVLSSLSLLVSLGVIAFLLSRRRRKSSLSLVRDVRRMSDKDILEAMRKK